MLDALPHLEAIERSKFENDPDNLVEAITAFAEGTDDNSDLDKSFADFFEHFAVNEHDQNLLLDFLIAASMEIFDELDAEPEEKVRAFLSQMRTYPQSGSTRTFRNDDLAKNFPIDRYSVDGNDDVFQARDIPVFDLVKNRYGNPRVDYNDLPVNHQVLANPRLNVAVAIDSVGQNQNHQWRVVRNGRYVTQRMMSKNEAIQLAQQLNQNAEQLQEMETVEEALTRKQTREERGLKEKEKTLPSIPMHEGLLQPLNPCYLQAIDRLNPSWTMSGSLTQSDHTVKHASDWKATQQLINERKKKFGEDKVDEHNAIRTVQQRALRK